MAYPVLQYDCLDPATLKRLVSQNGLITQEARALYLAHTLQKGRCCRHALQWHQREQQSRDSYDASQLWWPQRWDGRRAQATVPGRTGQERREDGGGPRRTGEEKCQRHLAKGKAGVSLTWVWQRGTWEPLWRGVLFGQHSVDRVMGQAICHLNAAHT